MAGFIRPLIKHVLRYTESPDQRANVRNRPMQPQPVRLAWSTSLGAIELDSSASCVFWILCLYSTCMYMYVHVQTMVVLTPSKQQFRFGCLGAFDATVY